MLRVIDFRWYASRGCNKVTGQQLALQEAADYRTMPNALQEAADYRTMPNALEEATVIGTCPLQHTYFLYFINAS